MAAARCASCSSGGYRRRRGSSTCCAPARCCATPAPRRSARSSAAAPADEVNYYLRLRKLHRALGLESVVRFAGPLSFDRVLPRYATADVVVLPAMQAADGRREVTPNALLEAMAMGCAVVSTPIGGIPEIIEDGVSGLLVPSGDAAALAAALMRLRDPAMRARLGAAARERVALRFDLKRNIQQYVALFRG